MCLCLWNPVFKTNRHWTKCWARCTDTRYLNPISKQPVLIFSHLYLNFTVFFFKILDKSLYVFENSILSAKRPTISTPLISSSKSYPRFGRGMTKSHRPKNKMLTFGQFEGGGGCWNNLTKVRANRIWTLGYRRHYRVGSCVDEVIKIGRKETRWSNVDWINLAHHNYPVVASCEFDNEPLGGNRRWKMSWPDRQLLSYQVELCSVEYKSLPEIGHRHRHTWQSSEGWNEVNAWE